MQGVAKNNMLLQKSPGQGDTHPKVVLTYYTPTATNTIDTGAIDTLFKGRIYFGSETGQTTIYLVSVKFTISNPNLDYKDLTLYVNNHLVSTLPEAVLTNIGTNKIAPFITSGEGNNLFTRGFDSLMVTGKVFGASGRSFNFKIKTEDNIVFDPKADTTTGLPAQTPTITLN